MPETRAQIEGCEVQLRDCESLIIQEAADKKITLASLALTYYWCRVSDERPDFGKINRAIMEHRGQSGLINVKKKADKLIKEKSHA